MLAGKEPVQGERLLMLVEKKKQNWDELTNDSFYPIGMTGTISDTGNNEFIVISSGERVNIESLQGQMGNIKVYTASALDLSKIPHPTQQCIGYTRRTARAAGYLSCRVSVNIHTQNGG